MVLYVRWANLTWEEVRMIRMTLTERVVVVVERKVEVGTRTVMTSF